MRFGPGAPHSVLWGDTMSEGIQEGKKKVWGGSDLVVYSGLIGGLH